jgi:glycosyltransferase involved in cell wall biosynthesis
LTAHNVNSGIRDGTDGWLNRLTLRIQYRLANHVFVHTEAMQRELMGDFGLVESKVSVIPFGINSTVPETMLSTETARHSLGLGSSDRVVLFFGNIAPYKGLEYLVEAALAEMKHDPALRLVIAGKPKGSEAYWESIRARIPETIRGSMVVERICYVPDEDVEVYFKAADVFVLPYTHIFQSGVLFLGYNFGVPVIATDVGSLREEILSGRTGLVCAPGDAGALARALREFFSSPMYSERGSHREMIRRYAQERYSWEKVGEITREVYVRISE